MLTEYMIVINPDDIVLVMRVIIVQELKNFQLHSSLVLELLFVPYNFDSHKVARLMIKTLDCLSKTTGAESILDLIPVSKMILHDCLIVTLIVIVAVVVNIH